MNIKYYICDIDNPAIMHLRKIENNKVFATDTSGNWFEDAAQYTPDYIINDEHMRQCTAAEARSLFPNAFPPKKVKTNDTTTSNIN